MAAAPVPPNEPAAASVDSADAAAGAVDDPLRAELTALARRLTPLSIVLTVGGGYGLVLKREHITRQGLRTRFTDPPYTRSTNDVDCFLTADLISEGDTTRAIRDALGELGYKPVDSTKYYQFARTIEHNGAPIALKFDFLAPPVTDIAHLNNVKMDDRRIRPRSYGGFHAHTTPEALTVGEIPTTIELGTEVDPATVRLPHPFTYLILKLHAFGDQVNNPDKDNGRYHAFDIYTTIALATEVEWNEMVNLREHYATAEPIARANEIRAELFGEPTSLGLIRLREYTQAAKIHLAPSRFDDLVGDLQAILDG